MKDYEDLYKEAIAENRRLRQYINVLEKQQQENLKELDYIVNELKEIRRLSHFEK